MTDLSNIDIHHCWDGFATPGGNRSIVALITFHDDDRTSPFYGQHSVIAHYRLSEPDKRPDTNLMWDKYGEVLARS